MAIADKAYVSAIQLLDKREINPNSLDIYNEDGLTDILGVAGRYKPTSMAIYHSYVNQPLFMQAVVSGAPTGAGTKASPLVITLSAQTSGYVRKTDVIKFPNGKNGYVTNVAKGAQDVITVTPVNQNATLAAASTNKLNIFTNAVGEKSLALENRRFSLSKKVNLIQVFREVNEETDIQSMSAIEVNFGGQARYSVKNLADKVVMHRASVNAALIGGQMSLQADGSTPSEFGTATASAITDPVGGGSTQFTRGLDEYIALDGVNDTVGTLDQVVMADFADLADQLLAKKTTKDFMVYGGSKVTRRVDDTLAGVNNLLTQGRLILDGQERNFSVQKLKYGGFSYQFANLPILDSDEMFGGTDISKSLYFIPTDKVKVRGGGSEPRLQIRYMKHQLPGKTNAGNDIWGEWHSGALAPTGSQGDEMIWRTNFITYQGLEGLGTEHFAKMKVLS
jgi:hypothetical protein